MNLKQVQPYLAEVLGTFTLVFIGATAIVGFGVAARPRSPSGSRCSQASTPSARSRAATSTRSSRS